LNDRQHPLENGIIIAQLILVQISLKGVGGSSLYPGWDLPAYYIFYLWHAS